MFFRHAFISFLICFSSATFAFDHILPEEWGPTRLASTPVNAVLPVSRAHLKRSIMQEFLSWQGTRYQWGGNTRQGIDCSAFSRRVIAAVLHRPLPRTALAQSQTGVAVSLSSLETGDLVFFLTQPGVHHVGIYIGNNQFIHASSSQGVTLSSLSNHYWREHYQMARRVTA
ncbi:glycoside hydrolase [Pseudocitrobacter sp. RIT415]|uniref:C40 family peptidase n=1 Tax=Pseudocitrobacter sp. RIT415 TaxID=2202163 RepID=UPI000D38E616|nr:NlpC/P60 family protein [Pseudocitrobacter sp. RIT 415]RAU50875.1 glycoside hydrolase [Pseudocitrobacter sp. RIT 415]